VTNIDALSVDPSRITLLSFEQERAYEIKYAGRPYPLASVRVLINGDSALVVRQFSRGPLATTTTSERWSREGGRWERSLQPH